MGTELTLSPKKVHYLKRELVTLQFKKEFDLISQLGTLDPLLKPTNGAESEAPFLRFLFHQYVTSFPLLQHTDQTIFWTKVQQFLGEFTKRSLNDPVDKSEMSKRQKMIKKIQKLLIILMGAGIKTVGGKEEGINIEEQLMQLNLTDEQQSLDAPSDEHQYQKWLGVSGLEVSVVGVREVFEKGHLREHAHHEFIVQTIMEEGSPVYVAHRHGAFRILEGDLRKAFPLDDVPETPSKMKDKDPKKAAEAHISRERDRLAMQAFLRQILLSQRQTDSEIMQKFLTKEPITLSETDKVDMENRARLDKLRAEEAAKFRAEVDKKVKDMSAYIGELKKDLFQPGGLLQLFEIIKTTEKVEELPDSLKRTLEWGRINFAFELHTLFITSDSASQNVLALKRIHSMMPYRTLRTILRYSNPLMMVKGILDLFLAQPFGQRSLFQRMMMVNLNEDIKGFQKDVNNLEATIDDELLCTKIRNAIYTHGQVDRKPDLSPIEHITEILRDDSVEPILAPDQIMKVAFATQAVGHRAEKRSVKRLYQLWILYRRKREQEMLMDLIFQGVTGDLFKDMFAIFYQPLAQVYKAANIGDSLIDVSMFVDELIQFLDSIGVDQIGNTVQPFIDLIRRHEQKFYTFVHNVHKQDSTHLFDNLVTYIDHVIRFMSTGLPDPIDIEAMVETQIPPEEFPALQVELDELITYHMNRKTRHLEKVRRKVLEGSGMLEKSQNETEFGLERDEMLVGIMKSDGDAVGLIEDVQELEFLSDSDDSVSSSSSDVSGDLSDENADLDRELHRKKPKANGISPPDLIIIPKLVQGFVEFLHGAFAKFSEDSE